MFRKKKGSTASVQQALTAKQSLQETLETITAILASQCRSLEIEKHTQEKNGLLFVVLDNQQSFLKKIQKELEEAKSNWMKSSIVNRAKTVEKLREKINEANNNTGAYFKAADQIEELKQIYQANLDSPQRKIELDILDAMIKYPELTLKQILHITPLHQEDSKESFIFSNDMKKIFDAIEPRRQVNAKPTDPTKINEFIMNEQLNARYSDTKNLTSVIKKDFLIRIQDEQPQSIADLNTMLKAGSKRLNMAHEQYKKLLLSGWHSKMEKLINMIDPTKTWTKAPGLVDKPAESIEIPPLKPR